MLHVIIEGLVGELWSVDPQTCPNFRLWQMAIPEYMARVRSGRKMSENA